MFRVTAFRGTWRLTTSEVRSSSGAPRRGGGGREGAAGRALLPPAGPAGLGVRPLIGEGGRGGPPFFAGGPHPAEPGPLPRRLVAFLPPQTAAPPLPGHDVGV